jgi:hypothetical protein
MAGRGGHSLAVLGSSAKRVCGPEGARQEHVAGGLDIVAERGLGTEIGRILKIEEVWK